MAAQRLWRGLGGGRPKGTGVGGTAVGRSETDQPQPAAAAIILQEDNFQERVVQIRRVTKVVKGGKQLSFRAVVSARGSACAPCMPLLANRHEPPAGWFLCDSAASRCSVP